MVIKQTKALERLVERITGRRPLKKVSDQQLLRWHNYFVGTPPEARVEGMNLDRDMVGPPITPEDLNYLIPAHRLVLKEMKKEVC